MRGGFSGLSKNVKEGRMEVMKETAKAKTIWTIRKYEDEASFKRDDPYAEEVVENNLLLNEGITLLQNLLTGGAGTPYNNANSYLGVGDSSTAAAATDTGLLAPTNKLYKAMEAGYPSISNQTTTWRAIYGATEANFAWNEFTVANGSTDASTNLNRKVSAQGTKTSGQVWTLDLAVTWS